MNNLAVNENESYWTSNGTTMAAYVIVHTIVPMVTARVAIKFKKLIS